MTVVSLLATLAAACGPGAAPTATPAKAVPAATATPKPPDKYGGTLVLAWRRGAPMTMDAQVTQGGGDHTFLWPTHDNLVAYDSTLAPKADLSLAKSWQISSSGTEVTFSLRQGIKFHDGTDFNAEAVRWNIARVQNPDTKAIGRAQMEVISKIEVVDPSTVKLYLKGPNASLLANLGDKAGMMVSPAAVQKWGIDYPSHPVGTGAFEMTEWVRDGYMMMKRNPNYWRTDADGSRLPYLDQIKWLYVPDATVRLANVKTGEAHLTDVAPANVAEVKADPKLIYKQFDGSAWMGLFFNTQKAPFDKIQNRQAIAWAIDRKAVVAAATYGLAQPAYTPLPPVYGWAWEPALKDKVPQLDIARAKELLKAAGNPDGFEFEAVALSIASYQESAEAVSAMLSKLGIKMKLTVVDSSTANERMFMRKDVPAYSSSMSIRADPDDMVKSFWHSEGFYNPGRLKDESSLKLDKLIEDATLTYDLNERKRLYVLAQEQIANEARSAFYFYRFESMVMRPELQGFEWGGEGKIRWVGVWLKK